MPSHYVDVDDLVAQYEYLEEAPVEFDEPDLANFINSLNEGE